MNIVAYVDESGTHDPTGNKLGAGTVAIGGLAALKEEWVPFDVQWRKILKKYRACYFHFCEQFAAWRVIAWGEKPASDLKKNPYKNWAKSQLRDFVLELAPLAASKLIIGGWVPTKLYNDDKVAGVPNKDRHPYQLCLDHLFKSYPDTIKRQRPIEWQWKPVAFLFDHSEDKEWRDTVIERFYFHEKTNTNFIEAGFRKKTHHTPLQAADMLAYRMRFNMDRFSNFDFGTNWPELDNVLFKSIREWEKARSRDEKFALLKKHISVPENLTYEQAMDSIIEESKIRHANKTKRI